MIATAYDGANRPAQVTGARNGVNSSYGLGISYAAQGAPNYLRYGNSLVRTQQFNTRLQAVALQDAINGSADAILLQLLPDWGSTANNGTLQNLIENNGGPGYPVFLTFTQNFSYDAVNRLSAASDTGGWSRARSYL